MSVRPLVSILLPVKNGGRHLQLAVDSLLQQQHDNIEIIVVDDGSDDGAVDALAPSAKVQVLANQGFGVSAATATAAASAQGDFLARMDADDIALPQRLEIQLHYLLQNPEVALCGGQVEIFTEGQGLGGGYQRYQEWINTLLEPTTVADNIYIESPIPNPTVMFRREAYDRLGGYRDTEWHEDYDLYLKAHHLGMKMGKPEGVLLRWRDHVARSTRNQPRYLEKQLIACKAHYLAQNELRHRAAIICGTGPVGVALHDALVKEGAEVLAFVDVAQRRIGGEKRGKPVIAYEEVSAGAPALYLGALGQPAARVKLQALFDEKQMLVWRDYLMCA